MTLLGALSLSACGGSDPDASKDSADGSRKENASDVQKDSSDSKKPEVADQMGSIFAGCKSLTTVYVNQSFYDYVYSDKVKWQEHV